MTESKRKTGKQLIEEIVEFFNGAGYDDQRDTRAVWNILTALRGPDSESDHLKDLTTARLRAAIGLKPSPAHGAIINALPLLRAYEAIEQFYEHDCPCENKLTRGGVDAHFRFHYKMALEGLQDIGFEVEYENKTPQ